MKALSTGLPRQFRPVGLAAITATAVVCGMTAWLLDRFDSVLIVRGIAATALLGFAAFAVTSSTRAARRSANGRRAPWILLTFGLVMWVASFTAWGLANMNRLHGGAAFPPVTWAGVLLPISCCLALLSLPAGYTRSWRVRLLLDGLILAGSVFLTCWLLFLCRWYDGGGTDRPALTGALMSCFADLVAVTLAVLMLARASRKQRRTLSLLLVAVTLMLVCDIALVGLIADHAYGRALSIAAGWALTMAAFGLAALSGLATPASSESPIASEKELVATWFPYALLITAGLLELFDLRLDLRADPMLAAGPMLVAAVLARQVLVVSANGRLLATVAEQAVRDPLTGVANRTLFNERLDKAIDRLHREQHSVAVLLLDLDDFKLFNDGLGHLAGDVLIRAVAERLMRCVRDSDLVARVGGDEFAVLIEDADSHDRVADRIAAVFDERFRFDDVTVRMRASLGLAVASTAADDLTADELLRRADVAMYTAKRLRSGTVQTFAPGMNLLGAQRVDQANVYGSGPRGPAALQLLGELRHAIDHGELAVVYQPQCSLRTGEIVCAETLLRWPHPERGLLEPDEFLPLVRHHGLMRPVTEWVLSRALDDAATWRHNGVALPVAVNIFAPLYMDPGLPRLLRSALDERGMTGQRQLCVEITEHLLVDDLAQARTVLETIRADGIGVALDDFGSGYSALSYLRELPIDEVKLDRDFIAAVLSFSRAATIVKAVIDLAHHLDVAVVAEGVENAQTAARLREFGCDLGQGFYHSPPVGAAAVVELFTSDGQRPPDARYPNRYSRSASPATHGRGDW